MSDGKRPRHHRKAQRAALWLLYAMDVAEGSADEALQAAQTVAELEDGAEDYWSEVERRVRGVADKLSQIDEIVQRVSPRWRIDRMARIDRNILRLGTWELLFAELPAAPVIDSCVDLGKEYGEKGTGAFVNGLLDQIRRDHRS